MAKSDPNKDYTDAKLTSFRLELGNQRILATKRKMVAFFKLGSSDVVDAPVQQEVARAVVNPCSLIP